MTQGIAESLGNELVARLSVLEGRADADSYNMRLVLGGGVCVCACACRGHGLENIPTLTAVLLSSSEALLPPGLLLMLMRLELRFGRIIALMGRGTPLAGEPGGEVAM